MSMFKLGSDPELMLTDRRGRLKSAIPVIKESKGRGRPLDKSKRNTVLHDNVLLELNTKPSDTEQQFVKNLKTVLKTVSDIVAKDNLKLKVQASANYPEAELDDSEAREFGCDPDYDAYDLTVNITSSDAPFQPFRSAGGHLHIGKGNDATVRKILNDPYGKIDVVKALDLVCGIASVFLDKDKTSKARRELYGKAGSHRPKTYGVEYRALGNWWLATPEATKLIYRLTKVAINLVKKGELANILNKVGESNIKNTINSSNKIKARHIFNKYVIGYLDKKTTNLLKEVDGIKANKDLAKSWLF